jgi:hypothetical protein
MKHLADHLEQIALFALPRRMAGGEDEGTETAAKVGSDGSTRGMVDWSDSQSHPTSPVSQESNAVNLETMFGEPDDEDLNRAGTWRKRPDQSLPQKRHVTKYGYTRLAEACETGDLNAAREWLEKDPDQLEIADFAGNKPLQIAALHGHVKLVDYLLDDGCEAHCANLDGDTPLIDAAENGHLEVVRLLLDAAVDPLQRNLEGKQALDVVTDEIDDASSIRDAIQQQIDQPSIAVRHQRGKRGKPLASSSR